jgi:DNA-binding transcriptional MocR family regulator
VPASARDVSTGGPDPRLLPRIPASTRSTGSYGQPDVHADLAAAATRRLSDDGVPVPALGVVSSALDAVERVLRDHLRPGDRIAVEDPGWGNLLDLVAALGLTPEPVRVDDDGPVPADLERALRRGARAAVVTSRAQNPTGAAIGAARARALRAVLRGHPDVVLIEDDHAAEVSGVPLHPVVGARTGPARWAFVRSAGKVWGPDLRVAVVVGDETTIDRVRGRLRLGPGWVSHLLQAAVADLWADPGAERTVARARVAYASRRAAVLDALADRGVAGHGRSGLNVWVPVPDETSAVTRLLAHGWAVAPGARFRLGTGPAVRITVADLGVREARELAAAVADAVRPTGRPAA